MTFKPSMSLEGLRVVSAFDIDKLTCDKLNSHIFQLGVILYPVDLINEKFLISVRDCMLKLSDKHPVKKWIKTQASPVKPNPKDQETLDFLNEMLNTQFNLITDQKVKTKVIKLLAELPETTNLEKLLKSYLYLMIGNITRSDRLLKEIISEPPRIFYQDHSYKVSIYHSMTMIHFEKVLRKFARHPADRLTFSLFLVYIKSFLNKSDLLEVVDDIEPDWIGSKLGLAYTLRIAPDLVNYARFARMSEKRLMKNLRLKRFSPEMQSFWVWPFLDVNPLVSEIMVNEVKRLDQVDPLWAVYLLDDEKLADLYFKKGGTPLSRRRSFLREHLKVKDDYMLTLYKLIEIGDIDEDLVQNVAAHLQHNE